jgi:hypothetical protein
MNDDGNSTMIVVSNLIANVFSGLHSFSDTAVCETTCAMRLICTHVDRSYSRKAGAEVMGVESIQACSTGLGLVESVMIIGPQTQFTEGNNLTPTLIVEPCFEGLG